MKCGTGAGSGLLGRRIGDRAMARQEAVAAPSPGSVGDRLRNDARWPRATRQREAVVSKHNRRRRRMRRLEQLFYAGAAAATAIAELIHAIKH